MHGSWLRGRQAPIRFPFVGSDKLIYAMDGLSKDMLHSASHALATGAGVLSDESLGDRRDWVHR